MSFIPSNEQLRFVEIINNLDSGSIGRLCQTNREFYAWCTDPEQKLWKYLMKKNYNFPIDKNINYRDTYIYYKTNVISKIAELYRFYFDFEYFLIERDNDSIVDFYNCVLKRPVSDPMDNRKLIVPGTKIDHISIRIDGHMTNYDEDYDIIYDQKVVFE